MQIIIITSNVFSMLQKSSDFIQPLTQWRERYVLYMIFCIQMLISHSYIKITFSKEVVVLLHFLSLWNVAYTPLTSVSITLSTDDSKQLTFFIIIASFHLRHTFYSNVILLSMLQKTLNQEYFQNISTNLFCYTRLLPL